MQARDGECGAEAWLYGGLGNGRRQRGGRKVAFGESCGADTGRKRQPRKGVELVVDVKGFADWQWALSVSVNG